MVASGIEPGTSVSVARNSDTEAVVLYIYICIYIYRSFRVACYVYLVMIWPKKYRTSVEIKMTSERKFANRYSYRNSDNGIQ